MKMIPHIDDPQMENNPIIVDPKEVAAFTPTSDGTAVILRSGAELHTSLNSREARAALED